MRPDLWWLPPPVLLVDALTKTTETENPTLQTSTPKNKTGV
jgi:hypothetical protein